MEFSLAAALPILERTPQVVRALVGDLAEHWTHRDYGPGMWTAHQIVGHLIWGERTDWMPRARHILAHGASVPFEPFERDGMMDLCRRHTTAELLDLFATERAAGLAALRALGLTMADSARPGLHPALGAVTLGQLLATWTVHDLNHIAQICRAMAYQYKEAVGPWEEYLSILAPPRPR